MFKVIICLIFFSSFKIFSNEIESYFIEENKTDFNYSQYFYSLYSVNNSIYVFNYNNRPGVLEVIKYNENKEIIWTKTFGYFKNPEEFELNYLLKAKEIGNELHLVVSFNPYFYVSASGHLKKIILDIHSGEVLFDEVDINQSDNYFNQTRDLILKDNGEFVIVGKQLLQNDDVVFSRFNFDNYGDLINIEYVGERKYIEQKNDDSFQPSLNEALISYIDKDELEKKYSIKNYKYINNTDSNLNFEFKVNSFEKYFDLVNLSNTSILFQVDNSPNFSDSLIVFEKEFDSYRKNTIKLPFEFHPYNLIEHDGFAYLTGRKIVKNSLTGEQDISLAVIEINNHLEVSNFINWNVYKNEQILESKIENDIIEILVRPIEENDNLYNCKIDLSKFSNLSSIEIQNKFNIDILFEKYEKSKIKVFSINGELIYEGILIDFKKDYQNYLNQKVIINIDNIVFKVFIQ